MYTLAGPVDFEGGSGMEELRSALMNFVESEERPGDGVKWRERMERTWVIIRRLSVSLCQSNVKI